MQRQPSCWAPPQARQPSYWEKPAPPPDDSYWRRLQQPYDQYTSVRRQTNVMPRQPRPRPSCWDPPTRAFEQPPYTYMDSYAPLRNSYARDHRGQPDYRPPRPPYTDSESHVQPQNSSSGYHLWQPEYRPSRQLPLPDRPLHPQPPPTPRQYSCWDPPGQRTTQAADSRLLSRTIEANVSGGKRTTWPGIGPYLTSFGEMSVNKEVDQQRLPNITCSKIDLADDNDIRATIKEQVDKVGRTLFFGKNCGAEPKEFGPLEFNLAPEDQLEELPRLPLARLKTGDKPFNWDEKYARPAVPPPPSRPAAISCSMTRVAVRIEFAVGGASLRKVSKDSLCVDERKFTFETVCDEKSGDLLDPTQ